MKRLSVVSPVYKTAGILPELTDRLNKVLSSITSDYEIIYVDDASPDNAWQVIQNLAVTYPSVRAIRLSRNFGQHCAIAAGLDACDAEYVVVMDSDLQDTPEAIPQLYQEAIKGTPAVIAERTGRTDSFFRNIGSRVFYYLLSRLSNLPANHTVANFGIYHHALIDHIRNMKERDRYFPMMVNWVGFEKKMIRVQHGQRPDRSSGYNPGKLIRLAFNITLAYSDKPLRYVVKIGFLISLFSFLYGVYMLVRYLQGQIVVLGYTSLIISIWFLGGLMLFTLGIVGIYVGKTFEGIKNRPLYIIEKKIN
jgi:dolichol-phosphate mannosyltransferase